MWLAMFPILIIWFNTESLLLLMQQDACVARSVVCCVCVCVCVCTFVCMCHVYECVYIHIYA